MTKPSRICGVLLAAGMATGASLAAQTPSGQAPAAATHPSVEPGTPGSDAATLTASPLAAGTPAALIKQAGELNSKGKQDQALAVYQQVVVVEPHNSDAHVGMGVVLDLEGRYDDARKHITEGISDAASDSAKTRALRTMAVSYAFTRSSRDATIYEQQVMDAANARQDYTAVADVANELARICLESGDIDAAFKWYQAGHESALRKPNLTAAERDLWDFRWEHAQARIAARRGQKAEAQQHVVAAKAILDKGTNPDQARFYPYLIGYVALYGGDYAAAIVDLKQGDQTDPFIASLIAQAYEKSGDRVQAMDYYRKVMTSNAHNPPNAFARPLARQKLAASASADAGRVIGVDNPVK
jgi:tetratricopeptide (TPR) repeat protein